MNIENQQEVYYTYQIEGDDIFDAEFKDSKSALEYAESRFCDKCADIGGYSNGEVVSRECEIIKFTYDDDGEFKELKRTETCVEYEHYHGDAAEHGTLWGLS